MNRPPAPFAVALLAAVVLAASPGSASAQVPVDGQSGRLAQALADYDAGRYRAAYDAFTRLADQGEPEAARIAILMARYGSRLYGVAFVSTDAQVRRWVRFIDGGGPEGRRPVD